MKRTTEVFFEEEDIPISERINKRARLEEKENHEHPSEMDNDKSSSIESNKTNDDNQSTDKNQNLQSTIEKPVKKRKVPSTRTKRKSKASWISKFDIEDCCIRLDKSDFVYDIERN